MHVVSGTLRMFDTAVHQALTRMDSLSSRHWYTQIHDGSDHAIPMMWCKCAACHGLHLNGTLAMGVCKQNQFTLFPRPQKAMNQRVQQQRPKGVHFHTMGK